MTSRTYILAENAMNAIAVTVMVAARILGPASSLGLDTGGGMPGGGPAVEFGILSACYTGPTPDSKNP